MKITISSYKDDTGNDVSTVIIGGMPVIKPTEDKKTVVDYAHEIYANQRYNTQLYTWDGDKGIETKIKEK